jgi:beta-glucosidase
MIVAHNEAYKIIKKNCPDSSVGFAKNNSYFEGGTLANGVKKYWNHYFLYKTKFDYIGLNYYFHDRIVASITPPFFKTKNENKKVSDMNWEIYPEEIFEVLMDLKKYKKPIIITENGLADAEDKLRGQFIVNHLKCIHRAIQNGVDVKGYVYWSLLDNFEWAYGFKPRFGLIEIDYKTQKRTIRKSALTYAIMVKKHQLGKKY